MKMDASYFIKKLGAVPSSKWLSRNWEDKQGNHCAMGHVGVNPDTLRLVAKRNKRYGDSFWRFKSKEAAALHGLFSLLFQPGEKQKSSIPWPHQIYPNVYHSVDVYSLIELPVAFINDGHDERYMQKTPKARVMAALMDIRDIQAKRAAAKEVVPNLTFSELQKTVAEINQIMEA